ncbi:hypothetical protein [Qipengyuania sp. JC766]|uniref:hypothetical protein n=1 Tax=Qipengyuania sp. JC766 TaxID=3232139 RepID=UPI00345869F9
MRRRHAGLIASVLATGLLGGCAFSPQLRQVAVDHNRTVAAMEDELTLLNIVRASERFPLHFTGIQTINGNVSVSATSGLEAELTGGADLVVPGVGGSVATNPSFVGAVYATEDFQRGIQQTIAPTTIASYLDEGWPDELLMALFIERVDIYDGNVPAGEPIENEPMRGSGFEHFLCHYRLVSRPAISGASIPGMAELIDRGLLADEAQTGEAKRKEIAAYLDFVKRDDMRVDSRGALVLAGSANSVAIERRPVSRCGPDHAAKGRDSEIDGDRQLRFEPQFRSVQGVIYFLGEYVRADLKGGDQRLFRLPFENDECSASAPVPQYRKLLSVERGAGADLVATRFRGERFFVPDRDLASCEAGATVEARSMQVIALVQQLLNLHKSADSLPTTLTISGGR